MNFKTPTKIGKQLLSAFLSLLIAAGAFLGIVPEKVSAASTTETVSYSYISGYYFDFSGLGLDCGSFKGQGSMIKAGSKPAYCIELGASVKAGSYTFNDSYNRLSSSQQQLINRTLIYGYNGTSKYGYSANAEYWATQIVCWIIETDYYDNLSMSSKIMEAAMSTNPDKTAIREVVSKIREQVDEHSIIPSFMTGIYQTPIAEYELAANSDGSFSLTKTDSNGVANYFDWSALESYSIKVNVSGSNVTFTTSTPINNGATFRVNKVKSKYLSDISEIASFYLASSSCQDLVFAHNDGGDPIPAYIKLKTALGHLKITKKSEDSVVAGMKFQIKGVDVDYDKTVTTGSDGTILAENLVPGKYDVTELSTPNRYVQPAKQTITVSSGQTTTVSFSNLLKKFKVAVTKVDSEKTSEQGDATLDGAVYGLYTSSGNLINSYTVKNGCFEGEYYPAQNTYLQEITPPVGYLKDDTKYPLSTSADNFTVELNTVRQTVKEDVIKGGFSIIKHTDMPAENSNGNDFIEQPEEGAEFTYYLLSAGSYDKANPDESGVLVTNEHGYASVSGLPYGTYRVTQTKGLEGHSYVPDFDVTITEHNKIYPYILVDRIARSEIKIVKINSETGKRIPAAGVGFKIKDLSIGEFISQTVTYPANEVIDTFYTTTDGTLFLPNKLVYNSAGYELHEVQAPTGYVLSSTPIKFYVTDGEPIEVEFPNDPQKGNIIVSKSGESFIGVDVSETDYGTLYTPVYEEKAQKGAVYEVVALEDIRAFDVNNTLIHAKDTVVGTITTDSSGLAKLINLDLGTYFLREVTAPGGLVLNEHVQTVTLSYQGQSVSVFDAIEKKFVNDRQKVELELYKTMEEDELFDLGANGEYSSVVFGVYAAEQITSASDAVLPENGLIGFGHVTDNGTVSFNADLPFGSYYVQEIATDEHYQLPTDENGAVKYPFTFDYEGQDKAVIKIQIADGELDNELIRGKIEGIKVDQDGKPLEAARIGLFRENEDEFTRDNALILTTSDENGYFCFEDVPYGNYWIAEVLSPIGYELDPDPIYVTVSEHGETVQIENIVNQLILGSVKVLKMDEEYPDVFLSGAIFSVIQDNDGNGLYDESVDTVLGTMEESDAGVYTYEDLLFGNYLLKEETAPDGFLLDENYYPFSIEHHEQEVTVENVEGIGFLNAPIKGSVEIYKVDADTQKPLANARFNIYDETGDNVVLEGSTDDNGLLRFENLRKGIYWIQEIESPEGYIHTDEKFQFEIKEHGEVIQITVENDKFILPKTGDDIRTIVIYTGFAVLSLGAVLYMYLRRRKVPCEENGQFGEDDE